MRTFRDSVTFAGYSSYSDLLRLILINPPTQPLEGQVVVITGIHPSSSRKALIATVAELGAVVRDEFTGVRPNTLVVVCPGANPGWDEANRAGRKLQRAERIGARVFRLSDLVRALRERRIRVPALLLWEEQLELFQAAATTHSSNL